MRPRPPARPPARACARSRTPPPSPLPGLTTSAQTKQAVAGMRVAGLMCSWEWGSVIQRAPSHSASARVMGAPIQKRTWGGAQWGKEWEHEQAEQVGERCRGRAEEEGQRKRGGAPPPNTSACCLPAAPPCRRPTLARVVALSKRPAVQKAMRTRAAGGMTKELERSGQNHSLQTLLACRQALARYLKQEWEGKYGGRGEENLRHAPRYCCSNAGGDAYAVLVQAG